MGTLRDTVAKEIIMNLSIKMISKHTNLGITHSLVQ